MGRIRGGGITENFLLLLFILPVLPILLFFSFSVWPVFACTDFVVRAQDGTLINGRSLEFAIDLQNKFQTFPRGQKRFSHNPKNEKSLSWTSKYGYLALTCFNTDLVIDGLNEAGLSIGLLWMPGTQYPTVKADEMAKALDFVDLGNWLLGNFATVAEIRTALQNVVIWGHSVPPLPGIPPIHVAIHDARGFHLVLECLNGETKLIDNPNTVLTNAPPLEWHLINITNYLNLRALNAGAVHFQDSVLEPPGQGSGLLGIPGDWTPPSRFVRASTFLNLARDVPDAKKAINLAEHLLNTVDIPLGTIESEDKSEDYTQWVVIKDLKNKVFYFRSYYDLTLKKIELANLDFSSASTLSINYEKGPIDVSSLFKQNPRNVTFK